MSAQPTSLLRSIIAALSAMAVVLGLTATAVALAPASSAADGLSRIEVINTQTAIISDNPGAGNYLRGTVDAWLPAVKVRATFTGEATYNLDGGTETPITSDRVFAVTLHDGVNAITITHNGNTYPIEILHPWKLTGVEIFDANAAPDALAIWSRRDAAFDATKNSYKITVPANVSSIAFKLYYDSLPDSDPSLYSTVETGNPCSDNFCDSGELTTSRGVGMGTATFNAALGWNGRANWNGVQASKWAFVVTRPTTASTTAITRVHFSNPTVKVVASESEPDVFTGAVPADSDSVDMRPIFNTGTATWSVNGSNPVAVTSGTKATVPMEIGLNTVLLTHRSVGGVETVYTYRFYRAFPITGIEIRDANNPSTILYSKTGDQFTQVGYPNPTWNNYDEPELQLPNVAIPNSVTAVQVRMFYADNPTSDPYVTWIRGLRANYNCPSNHCDSGEWSNSINVSAGQPLAIGPAVRVLPADTLYFTDWRVRITRATSSVTISGITVRTWFNNGNANAGSQLRAFDPTGVTGSPAPTIRYQWQSKGSGDWEDIAGATSFSYVVPPSLKDRIFRVKAWASNGVAPDSAPVYSGQTRTLWADKPLAPRGVNVVPGNAKVTVSWAETPYADSVTSYTASAVAGDVTKTCTTALLTCEITGLVNGTSYTISVVATIGTAPDSVTSTASVATSATPGVAVAPTMTAATITGTATVGERLTAGTTALSVTPAPAAIAYVWETAPASTGPWTALAINGESTTLLGQAAEGTYVRVRITASNSAGSVSRTSAVVGPVATGTGFKPDYILDFKSSSSAWTPPTGLAFDAQGALYTNASGTIFKYAPGSTATDLPIAVWRTADNGDTFAYTAMSFDGNGYVWVLNNNGRVYRISTSATSADLPEYRFAIDAANDRSMTVDRRGYLYASQPSSVGVYDLATGEKVRHIWIGSFATAQGLSILSDGNLFLAANGLGAVYEGGPTGSNTPLRTFETSTYWNPAGAGIAADGRIWIDFCRDGVCALGIYDLNATGPTKPLFFTTGSQNLEQGAVNPLDNQMYLLSREGQVFGFDASTMGLGTAPTAGAPGAQSIEVTGNASPGDTLTGSIVGIRGVPAPELSLQWQVAATDTGPWTDIDGETTRTYVVARGDLGKFLRLQVRMVNSVGETAVNSAATSAVTVAGWAPVAELTGAGPGIYRPLQVAYLADGRIAVMNESSNAVSIVDTESGEATAFIRVAATVAGVSAARGGGVWVISDNKVQKWSDASGTWTMTRELVGATAGYFSGASRVAEDAAGYLYVQFPYNKAAVFAPGAANDAAPLRELPGCTEGIAIDLDGNVLVGCDGWIMIYAGGASTNTKVIGRMDIGIWVDNIEVDPVGRVWIYNRSGQIRVYNPRLRGTVTETLRILPDSANKIGGATTFSVSPTTVGAIASNLRDTPAVNLYDWSTLLPAVPAETTATVPSVTITGTAKVSQDLLASAADPVGYPTGTLNYQWQVSDNGTSGWTDIPSATSKAYLISGDYADKYVRVKAWATNHAGEGAATYSAATSQIEYGPVRTQIGVIQGSQDSSLQQTGLVNPWYMTKLLGDRFVVSNRFNSGDFVASYSVFPLTASNNAAPSQVIRFPNLAEAWGSAVTSSGSLLLSAWLQDSTDHIYEVAGNADGFPTPTRDLQPGCQYGSDIAVGSDGLIYVACYATGIIKVFAADADGAATPLRTMTLPVNPLDIGFMPDGKLYVMAAQTIYFFEAGGASASTDPINQIETGYNLYGMTFDPTGRPLVAAEGWTNIYAPGFSSLTPIAQFSNDEYSRMDNAQGIIYDTARNDILVANAGAWRIQRYDLAELIKGDPTPPAQVATPTVSVGNRRLVVSWTALTQNVTGYRVNVTDGTNSFLCTTTTATTCTMSFSGTPSYNLVNGTEYSVTVTGVNGRVRGTASTAVTATPNPSESDTPPNAPSNVRATALDGVITVRWDAPAGTASKYQARATLGTTVLWCGKPTAVTTLSCSIPNATVGKTYSIDVRAIRVAYPTMISDWSTAKDVLVKSTPTIGSVTITGTPKATNSLSATAPKVLSTPASTVTYTWQTSGSSTTGFKDVDNGSTTLSDYALSIADVGDYVRLKVSADNGTGDPVVKYSNVIGEILTKDGETKASLYVVKGVKLAVTGTTINVSWAKPVLGQPSAYTLTLKPKSGTTVTKTFTVTDSTLDRMDLDVKGLAAGTTYTVTVQVEGKAATISTAVSALTAVAPAAVKSLKATVKLSAVTVTWSPPVTTFVGTYTVTLTSSTRTYSATVSGTSKVFQPVVKGTYTVKVVAISDVGVTGAAATVTASVT